MYKRQVSVFTQDKGAVCAATVDDAITRLFADVSAQQATQCTTDIAALGSPNAGGASTSPSSSSTTSTTTTTTPAASGSAQDKLNRAAALFDQADQALADKDLATYQSDIAQARALVKQAQSQLAGGG